jgi:serine/threonine protein kinase
MRALTPRFPFTMPETWLGGTRRARASALIDNPSGAMKSSRRISPGCTGFSDRFQREARTIAALNHPNICTLYDVGRDYLVMEYIDGKPPHGPLPVATVLRYAAQICDALDTAHRRGITHRDLKPANILVTSSGVKLLDFGLAKTQPEPIDGDTETLPEPLTGASMIVGMPHYMAPEQVEGKRVDARTDIFALGCVFYELIAGNKAFRGQRGRLNPQRRSRSTLRG